MTIDEIEELKQNYIELNKEYAELKEAILCLEKKGSRNMYLLKKEELVTLLKYQEMRNRYLEKEMTDFCDQWIHKDKIREKLVKINEIKNEFKSNIKKAKNKKEQDYWEQQVILLLEQEKCLKSFIEY